MVLRLCTCWLTEAPDCYPFVLFADKDYMIRENKHLGFYPEFLQNARDLLDIIEMSSIL